MTQPGDDRQPRLFDEPATAPAAVPPRDGQRRLRRPERTQVSCQLLSLDDRLPEEHQARTVWAYVERLDLSALVAEVQAVEGGPGGSAADPRLLLALWLYATLRGVTSARELDRLCREHLAYQWLCGGVATNYHSLSDFRVAHEAFLDELLTHSVAVLLHQGLVTLERVAQDGVRVRAAAGAASFHRELTLDQALGEARAHLAALKAEAEADPGAATRRQQAARERAARERCARLEAALAELPAVAAKKKPVKAKAGESADETAQRGAPRVSASDPEARVMKQGDGGYRPAVNVNFATTCVGQVIVGVAVTNVGSDHGLLVPMADQVAARLGQLPAAWLADNGFDKHEDIEALERAGVAVYLPPQRQRNRGADPYTALPDESEELAGWRQRMGTDAAQEVYRERAATAECVNAQARNRGLRQLPVRGLGKARVIALWYALAHNLARAVALGGLW